MKPKILRCRRAEAALIAVALSWGIGPARASASALDEPSEHVPTAVAAVPLEAAPNGEDDLDWELQSVRELLRRDIQDALRPRASHGRPSPGPSLLPGAAPVARPRLVAMYGVGQRLMAEVHVGGRAFLYVRGQALPVGHAGDPSVYRLRGMNGACVQLERGEDRHSLCLRALLTEARQ